MSMSLLPGLPGMTAGRSFSFYPPILGIAHNEWRFRRSNWSDFVVVNTHTGAEACIPRNFVADISANAPTMIVGLTREMEWRDGMAVPYRRPVVQLPIAVNDTPRPARRTRSAPVVSIRLEPPAPVKSGRKAVVFVMLGIVASAITADVFRPIEVWNRISSVRVNRVWQELKPVDDYSSIVRRLGPPVSQRTYIASNGDVFRSLHYPRFHFSAILEGRTENEARYIGSLDAGGRVLGSGAIPSYSVLHSIPRF